MKEVQQKFWWKISNLLFEKNHSRLNKKSWLEKSLFYSFEFILVSKAGLPHAVCAFSTTHCVRSMYLCWFEQETNCVCRNCYLTALLILVLKVELLHAVCTCINCNALFLKNVLMLVLGTNFVSISKMQFIAVNANNMWQPVLSVVFVGLASFRI